MVTYTAQTDWIKGHGVVVWLSFFVGIVGSGAYLVSLYFNSFAGTVLSWLLIAVLKGGLHVSHSKRPAKLWRIMLKVRTSWIARGTVVTALTALFGAVQIVLSRVIPGAPAEIAFKVLTGLAALAVMIYEGFTINYIKGIPFWNSSLLPPTLISWGMLTGVALMPVVGSPASDGPLVVTAGRIILVITAILTALYLWNAVYADAASKESMRRTVNGAVFWVGTVFFGIIAPLVILFSGTGLDMLSAVAFLVSEIVGSLAFTYCVLRAGTYRPLIEPR
jgi:formate-dependent nitrite reductase membrane component NrfD